MEEYINTVNKGILPIAFGRQATGEEAMAKWFNMRLYGLGFRKEDFSSHFDCEVEAAFGKLIRVFRLFKVISAEKR